jgi:hypothetical protein
MLDVLDNKGQHLTLAELVKDSGFARSTVIIHLDRFGSEKLVLNVKKPIRALGCPEFLYDSEETLTKVRAISQR